MALTAAVIDNVANAALDYYFDRGKVFYQHIQDKPLLAAMKGKQKMFPGGKENISLAPIFETQSSIEGFNSDDTLSFTNPTPIKRANYPWKMLHLGITMTTDELLRDGISVVDTNGASTSNHSGREQTALANILEVKLADASEGFAAGFNEMLWRDGTQDAKEIAGIPYFISDDPTTGTVGGISRVTQPLWRNRALTGANSIVSNTTTSALIVALTKEARQLTRYGRPKHVIFAGSDFIDALQAEIRAKGIFTQSGFSGSTDIGFGEISLGGIGTFKYDPTLDTLGKSKYCYFIDTSAIQLMAIEGEDMKKHFPARPHDKMVIYRSVTWAGALVAKQLNTSGVYKIS